MKFIFTAIKPFVFLISIFSFILFLSSCKKDQLNVDREKEFVEVGHVSQSGNFYDNSYTLTLMTGGKADILPGGDIVWRGTYQISGKTLTVKADHQTYKFDIISETELKLKGSDTILRLQ